MSKMTRAVLTALSIAALGYAATARSDISGYQEYDNPTPSTHVASTCAPDETAVGKYAFSGADFTFKSTAYSDVIRSGAQPITVRCNVADPLDGDVKPYWNSMIVGYVDPDSTGLDTRVVAKLYQVNRLTGGANAIATFDSNGFGQSARGEAMVNLKTLPDFHNYEYFVQLDLYRANQTALIPAVYSVRLVSTTAIPR